MNDKILELFEKTNSKLSGHFLLASGRHSDTYMQCARLFMHSDVSKEICQKLYQKLSGIEVDYVASPAIGGILMGYEMSSLLKCPNIFFERVDKEMTLRRGFEVVKGAKYLVVEDVVTTGGSVLEVCEQIKLRGGIVSAIAAIVDRSAQAIDFGAPFISLVKLDIKTYKEENCPLCQKNIPLTKPGTKALNL